MKNKFLTYDDVLILPNFSSIDSRKDVDISSNIGKLHMRLPIFSANMDTITGPDMAVTMAEEGALGVLHRFSSVEDNLKDFTSVMQYAGRPVAVSIGLGLSELHRAEALAEYGASKFFIDVAHGSQQAVVNQYNELRKMLGKAFIVVGNFATPDSISQFISRCELAAPDAVKVGVGPGSACTTRVKTGVGVPQFTALQWCNKLYNGVEIPLIADGGIKTPGDVAKALAAGADAVMIGGMFAGTDETPGEFLETTEFEPKLDVSVKKRVKLYRGSASTSSYKDQNKSSGWRTAEGEEFFVPAKGSVVKILKDIEGGLRSAMSYVGARTIKEFQEKAQFIEISTNSVIEGSAHGKK